MTMVYVLKPGQGSLFKNDRKITDNHPDYNGSICLPDGTEHWFSAWIKDGAKGKFFSVQVGKPKEARADHQNERPKPAAKDMDDEIPF